MAIRILGKLETSAVDGVLADAKQISGSYMTVTSEERNNLSDNLKTDGMLVYDTTDKKEYRWNSNNGVWEEVVLKYGDERPQMDGNGSQGTSDAVSRADHQHPSDSSKFDKTGGTISGPVTVTGLISATGGLQVGTPSTDADAANKGYVDGGFIAIPTNESEKSSVRETIGAVGVDDVPTADTAGPIKMPGLNYGIEYVNTNGGIRIKELTTAKIEGRASYNYEAVTLAKADEVIKASLTNPLVEYLNTDKTAACETIGAVPKTTTTGNRVYVSQSQDDDSFINSTIEYTTDEQGSTLALRGSDGTLAVGDPTAPEHATTKDYVDNNFVAKVTDTSTQNRVYGVGASSTDTTMFNVQSDGTNSNPISNTIPLRNANGQFDVGTPQGNLNVANKQYIDDGFVAKPTVTSTTKILTINSDGTGTLNYSSSPSPDSVPIADSNGNIKTNTPTENLDCANKAYVDDIFDGSQKAISYENYGEMVEDFNALDPDVFKVGQNIMIVTLNVPDLWISGIADNKSEYQYQGSDESFVSSLNWANKRLQVGYYILSPLETQKVDLTNYVTLNAEQTISASKRFINDEGTAGISFSSSNINPGIYSSLSTSKLKITENVVSTEYKATQINRWDKNNKGNYITNYFKFPVNEIDQNLTIATQKDIDPILEGRVTSVTFNITKADTQINFGNGLPGITQVNWGDGTIDKLTTHTYKQVGEYVCKIYDLTEISFSNELVTELHQFNVISKCTIGRSVTTIGNYAFRYCSSLTSIVIPDSVTTIGNYAFYNCSSLTSVEIGDSVTSIDNSAFENCSSLTSVVIPDSVTSIGDYAFRGCSSLTSVIIPNSVTTIGVGAFENCSSLTSVVIPGSVETLEPYMFGDCSGLNNITICDGVKHIKNIAFSSNLDMVVIPQSVESMFSFAFPTKATIIFKGVNPIPYQYTFTNQHAIYVPKGTLNKYIEKWSTGLGFDQKIIDKMYESDDDRNAYLSELVAQTGTGKDSIQQLPDNVADGFAFAEYNDDGTVKSYKNPNAIEKDANLKTLVDGGGKIPYGARGNYSSAFGGKSSAQGKRSHAEGTTTIAKGNYSHAEGDNSVSIGPDSHAEGYATTSYGTGSHAEGCRTISEGSYSHVEGINTVASLDGSHAEGFETLAENYYSHAEGRKSCASGIYSHAEGNDVNAVGPSTHAEGDGTTAEGTASHAEGVGTYAYGEHSHVEGYYTQSYRTAKHSHAEGNGTNTKGEDSHAEGANTVAEGDHSHVGGINSTSIGWASFAHGNGVIAQGTAQTVVGRFNNNDGDAIFEVGNGTAEDEKDANGNITKQNRSTAFKVMGDGRAKVYGAPTQPEDVIRKQDIIDIVYPIGSIYISVSIVNPSVYLGGEWELIQDAYLRATNLDKNETPGNISGDYKIKSNMLPEHTHSMSHTHNINIKATTPETNTVTQKSLSGTHFTKDGDGAHTHSIKQDLGSTASGRALRTTDFISLEQNSFSQDFTQSDGAHRHAINGLEHEHLVTIPSMTVTVSGNTFDVSSSTTTGDGNFANNEYKPKYLSVVVWKRIG